MSGNVGKICRQRQERRPSFSIHSCPGISFSPSRISSSSSHGNSISTKERKAHFHCSCEGPVCKKQCWIDNQTKKTFEDIRSCKSIDSIYCQNERYICKKRPCKLKSNELGSSLAKKRSRSYPLITREDISNECECAPNVIDNYLTESHKNVNSVASLPNEGYEPTKNIRKIITGTAVITQTCVREVECVTKNPDIEKETCVSVKPNHAEPKLFFPNSLLLFPFPATPVEKCLSPKTPCLSPLTPWANYDKTEPPLTDTKKSRGSRFDFGATFLRRFSLTQLTS